MTDKKIKTAKKISMAKFEFKNGVYEGEAVENVPNGKGKMTWEDGKFYEGNFLNGSFHGYGKFVVNDLGCFEGIWVNHSFVKGKASYHFACSGYEMDAIYEGRFKEFFLVGYGKITRANGEIYEGGLLNGKPHGKGKLTSSDGTVVVGTWTEGVKDYEHTDEDYENAGGDERFGESIENSNDSIKGSEKDVTIETFEFKDGIYKGEAIDNVPHGKGKITWSDGSSSEGTFTNGILNGKVQCILSNGEVFIGEFKNNLPNGKGTLIRNGVPIYKGELLDGAFCGHGTRTLENGTTVEGEWIDNEFIDSNVLKAIIDTSENDINRTLNDFEIATIYRYLLEAEQHMCANNFSEELNALSKALSIAPNNPGILVKIGRCQRQLGEQRKAIQAYEKAIECDPSFGVAYTNLGTIYVVNQRWTEAKKAYDFGLPLIDKNTDDYWQAYANYAVVIAKLGDPERANEMIIEADEHGYTNGNACRSLAGIL